MSKRTIETQREDAQRIGLRVRWARKIIEISVTELAADCGVDASAIRHIENGSRLPSLYMLMSLCHTLRVSPQYLLWGSLEGVDLELAARLKQSHPQLRWPEERADRTRINTAGQNNGDGPTIQGAAAVVG